VDLFVQFYQVVGRALLPRLLALLTGFMRRPHARLAAVGLDAFMRLMADCGPLFAAPEWDVVLGELADAVGDTLPDVYSLVGPADAAADSSTTTTAPAGSVEGGRRDSMGSTVSAVAVSPGGASRDGRRLDAASEAAHVEAWLRLRAQLGAATATQQVLVAALGRLFFNHGHSWAPPHTASLLRMLVRILEHARAADGDRCLRSLVALAAEEAAAAAAARSVPASSSAGAEAACCAVLDPPLLQLEVGTAGVYLRVLLALQAADAALPGGGPTEASLVALMQHSMLAFIAVAAEVEAAAAAGGVAETAATTAARARATEVAERATLLEAVLVGLRGLHEAPFRRHLDSFYGPLTQLIRCEAAPMTVHRQLSAVFAERVGRVLQERLRTVAPPDVV
jgi:brefeldin A-inhibited guanine nucleotide-exchange protein